MFSLMTKVDAMETTNALISILSLMAKAEHGNYIALVMVFLNGQKIFHGMEEDDTVVHDNLQEE